MFFFDFIFKLGLGYEAIISPEKILKSDLFEATISRSIKPRSQAKPWKDVNLLSFAIS